MTIIAGIDEAGYGPTLGPLVVTAVGFRVPGSNGDFDFSGALSEFVETTPSQRSSKVCVCDSKKIFSQSKGLRRLEESTLAFIPLMNMPCDTFLSLLSSVTDFDIEDSARCLWHRETDTPLPEESKQERVQELTASLRDGLQAANIQLCFLRSKVLPAQRFNAAVDRLDNKSMVLFEATAELMSELMTSTAEEDVFIVSDKHGGRNRYGSLLASSLPITMISRIKEGSEISVYRANRSGTSVEVSFRQGADTHCFPAALASMVSKYIRELFMRTFSRYWTQIAPHVKPTAGYPTDARRFLQETEDIRRQLAIPDEVLIRKR